MVVGRSFNGWALIKKLGSLNKLVPGGTFLSKILIFLLTYIAGEAPIALWLDGWQIMDQTEEKFDKTG